MHQRRQIVKGSTGPPSVHLPADLYKEFTIPQFPFFATPENAREKRYKQGLGGISKFMQERLEAPTSSALPPNPLSTERLIPSAWEMKEKRKLQRRAQFALAVQSKLLEWNPFTPGKGDASLTLFVGALDPKIVTETMIRDFMRAYGPVVSVRIARNMKQDKNCYAFVEFQDKKSLQNAYHGADKQVLGGRVILADVERGRTVSTWLPRRFFGGIGGPARIKGYRVCKGRGNPEPPKPVYHNRRRRFAPPPPPQYQQVSQQQQRGGAYQNRA